MKAIQEFFPPEIKLLSSRALMFAQDATIYLEIQSVTFARKPVLPRRESHNSVHS